MHNTSTVLFRFLLFYSKMFLFVLFAAVFFSCSGKVPKISMIDPQVGKVGENINIRGENFGAEKEESYVSFGGFIPTGSSYKLWSDNLIIVVIPDFGESALVYVHRDNHKSNPLLFSTFDYMPVVPQISIPDTPVIKSVDPKEVAVEGILKIKGMNFGTESGKVLFTWGKELSEYQQNSASYIEASSYELWDDTEIRLRVPDSAAAGNIKVVNSHGESNKFFLSIDKSAGEKIIKDKKTYTISYGVDVRVNKTSGQAALFLALPVPPVTATQLNRGLLSGETAPFIENYRGVRLYKYSNLKEKFLGKIFVTYLIDVYSVETKAIPSKIPNFVISAEKKTLLLPISDSDPDSDSDIEEIKAEAAAIVGSETNSYFKARTIYRALLKEEGDGIDSFKASMRFSKLCRAVNVPAFPAAGVLVIKNKVAVPHCWAFFMIDGLGFIPVDIMLGRGTAPESFNLREDYQEYYFGNLDNSRIVFSYGQTTLSPMDVNGRTSSREKDYALQNIWEESTGGLDSYSSHWSEIEIIGVY
jgi:hypothetical protein